MLLLSWEISTELLPLFIFLALHCVVRPLLSAADGLDLHELPEPGHIGRLPHPEHARLPHTAGLCVQQPPVSSQGLSSSVQPKP